MHVDGPYIRACKRGALQFVFLKPILAMLTLILTWCGVYGDQEIKGDKAYPYIAFVYNLSYTVALYSLLLFYLGAHELLQPYKPLLKFVLVKAVIFLTFWQEGGSWRRRNIVDRRGRWRHVQPCGRISPINYYK